METVDNNDTPIVYTFEYVSFTDIKDFDFDRVSTDYSKFEYDESKKVVDTQEDKFYFKDRRKLTIKN